ncbi:MAG: pyridoxamine 5'-phosphate oxidase family protein [Haloarculaceae archaeon]
MSEAVPADVEELLTGEPTVAHLATARESRPHSAPVWYRYADGVVEVVTTGRKLRDLRSNPRVSLSVHCGPPADPEWTATLWGTATVVDDEDQSAAAARRINRRYGVDPEAWSDNTLVRIDVGSASARTY